MKTILCIDDQPDGLEVRKAFLEACGYRALTATSGPAGLEIAARERLDLVLLDYKMAGMNGVEVAQRLRRLYPRLPLVMLTGYALELPSEASALCNCIVPKGRPASELLQVLEQLFGESEERLKVFRDRVLDMSIQQARRSRESVKRTREQARRSRECVKRTREQSAGIRAKIATREARRQPSRAGGKPHLRP